MAQFRKKHWIAITLVAIIAIVGLLELTNTTYLFHAKKVPATIPAKVPSEEQASKKTGSSSSQGDTKSSSRADTDKSAAPGGTNDTLLQPFGTLVSNHFPGKNGSDTKEQSTCNTTPGAKCYVQFKNVSSGKTTRLAEQTAGSNGTVLWAWNANTLTPGKWEVTATASLNGETKTVTDSIKLEVQ